MLRDEKVAIAAIGICLLAGKVIELHLTRSAGKLLLPILLVFFMFCVFGLVGVVTKWRQRRWRAIIPLAVCVFAVVIFLPLERLLRQVEFAWALPSYERVVTQMQSGSIPVADGLNEIPEAEPEARLVFSVLAEKTANGVLMVEFDPEGNMLRHFAYLYSSSGVIEPGSQMDSQWPERREIRRGWFSVSN